MPVLRSAALVIAALAVLSWAVGCALTSGSPQQIGTILRLIFQMTNSYIIIIFPSQKSIRLEEVVAPSWGDEELENLPRDFIFSFSELR